MLRQAIDLRVLKARWLVVCSLHVFAWIEFAWMFHPRLQNICKAGLLASSAVSRTASF